MSTASTQADRDLIERLVGMPVGGLTSDESESFGRCVKDGFAFADGDGNALRVFFGMAKVRVDMGWYKYNRQSP